MSWVPADLSQFCNVYTTVTSCQPNSLLFLQLIATLLGGSRDNRKLHGSPSSSWYGGNGNSNWFDSFYEQPWTSSKSADYSTGFDANSKQYGGPTTSSYFSAFDKTSSPYSSYSSSPSSSTFGPYQYYSGANRGFGAAGSAKVKDNAPQYDFIVVGAGSAGCVVANRLSEIKKWKVLLVEAGGEEPEVAEMPAYPTLLQRSSIDWGYMTQPQSTNCRARRDGRCWTGRGRVMGGSSTINYMIYFRGSPRDYDDWAALGNPGWSYREVLPYFKKSEDNRNPEIVQNEYHGTGGYQTVERAPYVDTNTQSMFQAFKEKGLPELDQNAEQQVGVMLLQTTTRNGERLSTNGAFIRPIRNKRKNLKVLTNARVSRIIIDPKTKTAMGIEYFKNGVVKAVFARKEVIVSAGAYDSPKLLMLSGVGPAEHLAEFGIDVIKNLRVGSNLMDHATLDGVMFGLPNETATVPSDQQRELDLQYWIKNRRGPVSSIGPLQVNPMVRTKYAEDERPDIQYSIDAVHVQNFVTDPILTSLTNINGLNYYSGFMIRPILLRPKSRGHVFLNNTDPIYGDPLIYSNIYTQQIDVQTVVEGIKQVIQVLEAQSLQKIGAQLVSSPIQACAHIPFGTDEYWTCMAVSYTGTIYHPTGTCKMGPSSDKDAVVDPKLRVHGIKRLRVIDGSIMPKIVSGNTNAPIIMIGERGSDFIKDAWLKDHSHKNLNSHSGIKFSIDEFINGGDRISHDIPYYSLESSTKNSDSPYYTFESSTQSDSNPFFSFKR